MNGDDLQPLAPRRCFTITSWTKSHASGKAIGQPWACGTLGRRRIWTQERWTWMELPSSGRRRKRSTIFMPKITKFVSQGTWARLFFLRNLFRLDCFVVLIVANHTKNMMHEISKRTSSEPTQSWIPESQNGDQRSSASGAHASAENPMAYSSFH